MPNPVWKKLQDRLKEAGWPPRAGGSQSGTAIMRRVVNTLDTQAPEMAETRDIAINGPAGPIPCRLYTPTSRDPVSKALIVFFHGGGFVMGGLESHDRLCRRMADTSRTRVIAADYRLAPAHPFPAALEDALAVYDAVGANPQRFDADPTRLGVMGDSAGGNLAAVIAQTRRTAAHQPRFQSLLYPVLQMVDTNAKRIDVLEGGLMSASILKAMKDRYLTDPDLAHDYRVSPLLNPDVFGLAPAHILTAGLDPLYDEGLAYAHKLEMTGIRVRHDHYARLPHGFASMTGLSKTALRATLDAGLRIGEALRR